MADVVGILGFTLHAAHKIYNLMNTFRDAPDEYKSLQKEADRAHRYLPRLADSPRSIWTDAQSLAEEAEKLAQDTYDFLEKVARRNPDGTYRPKKRMFARSLWTGDAKRLAKSFARFNQSLGVVLGMHNT